MTVLDDLLFYYQANIKALGDSEVKDGEILPLAVKDMGSCEIFPQDLQHNPNGRWAHTSVAISNVIYFNLQHVLNNLE